MIEEINYNKCHTCNRINLSGLDGDDVTMGILMNNNKRN